MCQGKSGGVGWLDLKGQDAYDHTLLGEEHVPLFKKGGLHNEPVGSHYRVLNVPILQGTFQEDFTPSHPGPNPKPVSACMPALLSFPSEFLAWSHM